MQWLLAAAAVSMSHGAVFAVACLALVLVVLLLRARLLLRQSVSLRLAAKRNILGWLCAFLGHSEPLMHVEHYCLLLLQLLLLLFKELMPVLLL